MDPNFWLPRDAEASPALECRSVAGACETQFGLLGAGVAVAGFAGAGGTCTGGVVASIFGAATGGVLTLTGAAAAGVNVLAVLRLTVNGLRTGAGAARWATCRQ